MEQRGQGVLLQLGTDDAQTAGHTGSTGAYLHLTGDVVKVQPLAVRPSHNALGTQHLAVIAGIQCLKRSSQLLLLVGVSGLPAPTFKHLIGVVMLVVVAAAAAFLAMLVLAMLVVMAAAAAFLAMLMVVMLVVVAAAFLAVLVVVMLMVMTAAVAFLAMLMVVMLVVVTAAAAFLAMLMVVMLLLLGQLLQRRRKSIPAFHGRQQLLTVQFVPRGRHDSRSRVLFPQQRNAGI